MGTVKSSVTAVESGSLLYSGVAGLQPNVPEDAFVQVRVGSPHIEGRERLFNDRRRQARLLRDRLDKLNDESNGESGATDLRSLSSTQFQLGVSANPSLRLDAFV